MRQIPINWRQWKVSEYFTYGEFYVSDDFPEVAAAMEPLMYEVANIKCRVAGALDLIRDRFGRLDVLSSVRRPNLQKLIYEKWGRKPLMNSQHIYGEADDITIVHADMLMVYKFITEELNWPGEVILYRSRRFIHIAQPSPFVKADRIIRP